MTSDSYLKSIKGTEREGRGFEIACAQLCGLGHYRMQGFMTVHSEESYVAWQDKQAQILLEEDDDEWGDDDW
jgi:heme/copper-type cytochrome/quinol oxidase subunit 2